MSDFSGGSISKRAKSYYEGSASVISVRMCLRSVRSCGEGGGVGRLQLPRRAAVFPLVIGELFHACAVLAHHKDFTIGLRRSGVDCLVLKTHARTGEQRLLSVGRPRQMSLVAVRVRELRQGASVGVNGHHLEVTIDTPDKGDQIRVG